MGNPVRFQLDDQVATITMDDGKVNALSPAMLGELGAALDRAEAEASALVLTGRPGCLSGGFDLAVLRSGGPEAIAMLRGGFELSMRLLAFPRPVVVACTGHAIAAGFFVLLSGDYRVGPVGAFRFAANEVAIGLTMPLAAVAILRERLSPAVFSRATCLAETFSPEGALAAGILDRVVDADAVGATARGIAASLLSLDANAHAATKTRTRERLLLEMRAGLDADFGLPAQAA